MIAIGETNEKVSDVIDFVDFYTDGEVYYQYNNTIWFLRGTEDDLELIRGTTAISWKTFFFVNI